jgi:hypothetical protein
MGSRNRNIGQEILKGIREINRGVHGRVTKADEFMGKRIKYSKEPVEAEVVRDFLPPPEQLAVDEEDVKITISLSRRSVEFFKKAAEHNNTSYQRMIRRLLDAYADRYAASLNGPP